MAKVKHRVGIEGSAESIYDCLTTTDGLAGWWASSASGTATVGSTIELEFFELAILCFRYEELIVDEIVCFKCVAGPGPWQDSTLHFGLKSSDQQVFVTLTHENTNCSEDDLLYFSTKWPIYLLSLKDFIQSGRGRPYPQDVKIHLGD